jgi:4-carboxymuconolactone decarboxylase
MSELTETGLKILAEIRSPDWSNDMRNQIAAKGFGSSMMALAADFVFGSVWSRPGLDRKQRSLVTLGILIALRQTEEFKHHVHIALNNGLTAAEIDETILQAAVYAGFPAANVAKKAAIDSLQEVKR